jgi:glycerol-3-phosphate acyltransferase PlsY
MLSYFFIVLAYLVGSIPFGLVIGKVFFHVDVREHGSGNIGASNVKRILGAKAGLAAFVLDILKGMLPVVAMRHYCPGHPWLDICTGLAAILGHNNSVFLKFTGGKGVATTCGVTFALSWKAACAGLLVFAIVTGATGYISLGSMISAPVSGYLIWHFNHHSLPYGLFGILCTLLVIIRHRSNIQRLLKGTELSIREKTPRDVVNVPPTDTVNEQS